MKSLALAVLLLAACAHQQAKPPVADAAPPPAPVAASPAPPAVAPAPPAIAAVACGSDRDCGSRQLCVDARCTDITAGLAACNGSAVHFGFDEVALAREDLPILERLARCASAGAAPRVLIEGNADERGTVEYNLALGDRRASAVAGYLERLGVPKAQLKTVSYGKEKPVCTEHDEACWSKNRRAALSPGADKDM
jgi:peptidoglycan-associated lipoprotein